MTMPERHADMPSDVQRLLQSARPEQIRRLLNDILKTQSNDDFNQTGTA